MPTRCLQAQKKPHRETRKDMTQRTSQKGEKQNHARAKSVEAANRGWMSEKYLPPADQVKCFFLTSPFIEPAGCFWPIQSTETPKCRGILACRLSVAGPPVSRASRKKPSIFAIEES